MTLTPDRTPGKSGKRSPGTAPGESAKDPQVPGAPAGESAAGQGESSSVSEPTSFREQLEAAGMDLTGNPLAGKLDSIAAVPATPIDDHDNDDSDRHSTEGAQADERVPPAHSGTHIDGGGTDRSATADECDSTADVLHPLLSDAEWRDLDRLAPELTRSIGDLSVLKDALLRLERPLGPDHAMTVVNGIETATRILEAMSAVALSVYERCGTPTDYGAKTTKALVQDRLNLTGYEANRRAELAKNLGSRVYMTGQAREPVNPVVAKALHSGVLSAGQATAINDCLSKLPIWISSTVRDKVEADLVEKAPRVRVSDLKTIFGTILDRIDPDGEEPKLPPDRSRCRINVRARDDGYWDLSGILDAVSGGILNGLLTSRILPGGNSENAQSTPGSTGGQQTHDGTRTTGVTRTTRGTRTAAKDEAPAEPEFDIFRAVLAGDVSDAPLPHDLPEGHPDWSADTGGSDSAVSGFSSFGVSEDGAMVDTSKSQGTVRNRIYERFATMISRVEMDRIGRGSPFALVVTAKAEDIATGKGRSITGCEAEFPISTAAGEGLNGSVFFHLMSDQAKTMEIATEGRYATNRQVAILAARDQGCTFPGCDAPPGWCDAHHIVPWADDGKTDINNLTLACGLHHHLIDRSDWYARMLHDGRPAWIPPPSIDVERRPILHSRFVAQEIIDGLSDGKESPLQ
ncbi:HNH endonuclease signature motif containing protein [Brevibacterium antiquum]|uniref:HNH endonuclease n=1 Tax=Brevibacterium antiquum TaxID=234835 RepID=A0A2H1HP78_9MICO|nr:HNH endonuclease signature motif containing protein [Brevibacterium antiquum]SMX64753.1 HNH endonuclease [Brevibacterium antiquum]